MPLCAHVQAFNRRSIAVREAVAYLITFLWLGTVTLYCDAVAHCLSAALHTSQN